MHRILLAVLLVAACSSGSKREDSPSMPTTPSQPATPAPPSQPAPRVSFATPKGDAAVDVEVVSSEAQVERGLMYRQNLPLDQGMLFLMSREYNWDFYMRNTLIPLDIIFIKKDMTVAGIAANAKPLDETLLHVGVPSLYVLEVNAGWAAAHDVIAGTKVKFERVPPRPAD